MLNTPREQHTRTRAVRLSSRRLKSPENMQNPLTRRRQSCCGVAGDFKRCSARVQYQSVKSHAARHGMNGPVPVLRSFPCQANCMQSASRSIAFHNKEACIHTSTHAQTWPRFHTRAIFSHTSSLSFGFLGAGQRAPKPPERKPKAHQRHPRQT